MTPEERAIEALVDRNFETPEDYVIAKRGVIQAIADAVKEEREACADMATKCAVYLNKRSELVKAIRERGGE